MIDNLVFLILKLNTLLPQIIAVIFVSKTVLFYLKKTRSWRNTQLLYFSQVSIVVASTRESYYNKIMQNRLSLAIGLLLTLNILLSLLIRYLELNID
jgi:vancomycin permeability regulator SanA